MSSPSDLDALTKQARRCLRKRQYAEAIDLYRQALAIDADRADVLEGMATACFLADDFESAAEHFKRITQLDPSQGKAFVNLGAVYNRMGEYNLAVDVLRKGVQKNKSLNEGFYNLGLAYRGLKQHSMAVSAYREAIRLNPEMSEAHQNLANVYVEMGNLQQAIIHYEKALEIRPEFERAKRGLANARNAILKAKQAISPFGRLVDESSYARKAAPRIERELSEQQRIDDRHVVYNLCLEFQDAADNLLAQLRDGIQQHLLALDRAVARAHDAPTALPKTYEEYRVVVERCVEFRRILKQRMLELRAHEELMNTPELNAPR